jgi:hypothetical protein
VTKGYALSGDVTAKSYLKWWKYNSSQYPWATHGNRFVNNHTNSIAKKYRGSAISNDNLTVTARRDVFAGALFIMEKTASGKGPKSENWR